MPLNLHFGTEAQTFVERIGSFRPKIHPKIAKLGPVLGTHAGPGGLVVALREGESETAPKATTEEPKKGGSLPSIRLSGQHFLYHQFQGRELNHPLRLELSGA